MTESEHLQRENADEFKRSEEIKAFLGPLCGLALAEEPARIATWTWWQGVKRSFEILEAKLAAAEAELASTRQLCCSWLKDYQILNVVIRHIDAAKTEVQA